MRTRRLGVSMTMTELNLWRDSGAFKIWVHCSSLGEFEQARPLIELIKKHHKVFISLSFYSPSGYESKRTNSYVDHKWYLPVDTKKNASKVVKALRPDLVLWTKYDLWFNYFKVLQKEKIPMVLFSATFRKNQFFFKSYSSNLLKILRNFDKIFTQSIESIELLENKGFRNADLAGDTRVDSVMKRHQRLKSYPLIAAWAKNQRVGILASVHRSDWSVIKEALLWLSDNAKLIVVPHDRDETLIEMIRKELSNEVALYSEAKHAIGDEIKLVVLDEKGHLFDWYQYGDWAYVGGGFNEGIHNILEPAIFGLPIIFGPNSSKFPEASNLVSVGLAKQILSPESIISDIESELSNEDREKITRDFFQSYSGGTQKVYDKIRIFLPTSS